MSYFMLIDQRGDIIQMIFSLRLKQINPLLEKTYLDCVNKIFMYDNKTLERNI